MSGGGRAPVKIVIINTQYVETDTTNFKSVVQKLTGKDSTVTGAPMSGKSCSSNRTARPEGIRSGFDMPEGIRSGFDMSRCNSAGLSRDLSFTEFDRLLTELPPIDELYRL